MNMRLMIKTVHVYRNLYFYINETQEGEASFDFRYFMEFNFEQKIVILINHNNQWKKPVAKIISKSRLILILSIGQHALPTADACKLELLLGWSAM